MINAGRPAVLTVSCLPAALTSHDTWAEHWLARTAVSSSSWVQQVDSNLHHLVFPVVHVKKTQQTELKHECTWERGTDRQREDVWRVRDGTDRLRGCRQGCEVQLSCLDQVALLYQRHIACCTHSLSLNIISNVVNVTRQTTHDTSYSPVCLLRTVLLLRYHQLFMNYQCEPTWPSTTFNVLQIEYTREISCHAWLACTITSFIGDSRVTNVGFSTTPATSINYQWWLWCTIHHVYITCYQSNYRSNDSSILHHFQSTLIYWRWTILSPGNPC